MLTARSLVKHFGTAPALDGVDFAVGPGESVAVTGPSGSGKSTLLHCLAGIMRPDSGEVRLFDERIDTLSERQRSHLRRTRFAFLFQFGQLLPELPADENVALPLMLGGTSRKAALEPARAELRRLGLEGKEGRRPGELSGGEAQRVALARALVIRPAVVFADEPTGALDRATGDQVMGILLDTVAELDAALVVVTHDPRIAARCTRTIEIRDGRLSGSPRTGTGERPRFDGFAAQGPMPVPAQGSVPAAAQGERAAGPVAFAAGSVPAARSGSVGSGGAAFAAGPTAAPPGEGRTATGSTAPDPGAAGSNSGFAEAAGPRGDAFAAGPADPDPPRSGGSGSDAGRGFAPEAIAPGAAASTRDFPAPNPEATSPGGSSGPGSASQIRPGPGLFGHESVAEVWR